jgi:hypothetical protein
MNQVIHGVALRHPGSTCTRRPRIIRYTFRGLDQLDSDHSIFVREVGSRTFRIAVLRL